MGRVWVYDDVVIRKDGPYFLMRMGVERTCYADDSVTPSPNLVVLYA